MHIYSAVLIRLPRSKCSKCKQVTFFSPNYARLWHLMQFSENHASFHLINGNLIIMPYVKNEIPYNDTKWYIVIHFLEARSKLYYLWMFFLYYLYSAIQSYCAYLSLILIKLFLFSIQSQLYGCNKWCLCIGCRQQRNIENNNDLFLQI